MLLLLIDWCFPLIEYLIGQNVRFLSVGLGYTLKLKFLDSLRIELGHTLGDQLLAGTLDLLLRDMGHLLIMLLQLF